MQVFHQEIEMYIFIWFAGKSDANKDNRSMQDLSQSEKKTTFYN